MNFVLDNSVTMRWFFGDGKPQELAYAGKVLDAMKSANAIVPATWGLEVANVIARAEAKGWVTEARSEAFLEMLEGVDIEVDAATFSHALSHTLQLARRYKLPACDASYLELSMRLGLPLATLGEDLQKAATMWKWVGRFVSHVTKIVYHCGRHGYLAKGQGYDAQCG